MKYNYLDHPNYLSYAASPRAMASLALITQYDFMPYPICSEWVRISHRDYIRKYIDGLVAKQSRLFGFIKRKSLRLGSVEFTYVSKHYSTGLDGYMVKMVDGKHYNDNKYFRTDMDFLNWFLVIYNFEGFGSMEVDETIRGLLSNTVNRLLHQLKINFYDTITFSSRAEYSKSHRIRHTVDVYYTLKTLKYALYERTFNLPSEPGFKARPASQLASDLEDVCNRYTNRHHKEVHLWVNEETDKRDVELDKELVMEMVRCIKLP